MRISTKGVLFLAILAISACKKDDTENTQSPFVSFINASPTLGTYNMYLGGTKLNSAAMPFGGIIAYTQYAAGTYTANYTTETGIEPLLGKSVTIAPDSIYSLFLIDKSPNLDALLVNDYIDASLTEKAYIRFINLSPDAPALDLASTSGEMAVITSKAYKSISTFIPVAAKDYTFEVRASATGEVKTTMANTTFTAGRYYTIFSRGYLSPGSADRRFSAQIMTNY